MCKTKGITQKELAKALNVMESHVSEVASGKMTLSLKFAQKLAAYFRCPLDVFIDGLSANTHDVERLSFELEQERAKSARLEERVKELEETLLNIKMYVKMA